MTTTPDTFTDLADCVHYLTHDHNGAPAGHYCVPCSRYGRTAEQVAPVAARASLIYAREMGEPWSCCLADTYMGLAVNDSEDVAYMLEKLRQRA